MLKIMYITKHHFLFLDVNRVSSIQSELEQLQIENQTLKEKLNGKSGEVIPFHLYY